VKPTEGIYYVVRFPNGWRLMACRFDEEGELGHPSFWRYWGVAALVAKEWQAKLRTASPRLTEDDLELLVYAFPRGRVTKLGTKYVIYHGNDLQPWMKITKRQIEKTFGVTGRCCWQFDEHEQCLTPDKEEMRRLLRLTEDWPSV